MTEDNQTGHQTCFVAMPFSKELQPVYDRIYEPVIQQCGLKPVRIDAIFRAGLITKDIFDSIHEATIVLADLTGSNPNVYYELGIAHRERKPVILTAQNIDNDIRFDVKTLRVIEYKRGSDDFWNDRLRDDLKRAITETLENPASAIATPWLGPIEATESGGKVGQSELRQIMDMVTSLYSSAARQTDVDARRIRELEDKTEYYRRRAADWEHRHRELRQEYEGMRNKVELLTSLMKKSEPDGDTGGGGTAS